MIGDRPRNAMREEKRVSHRHGQNPKCLLCIMARTNLQATPDRLPCHTTADNSGKPERDCWSVRLKSSHFVEPRHGVPLERLIACRAVFHFRTIKCPGSEGSGQSWLHKRTCGGNGGRSH